MATIEPSIYLIDLVGLIFSTIGLCLQIIIFVLLLQLRQSNKRFRRMMDTYFGILKELKPSREVPR